MSAHTPQYKPGIPRNASTSAISLSTSASKSALPSGDLGLIAALAEDIEGDEGCVDGGDERFEGEDERGDVLEDNVIAVGAVGTERLLMGRCE